MWLHHPQKKTKFKIAMVGNIYQTKWSKNKALIPCFTFKGMQKCQVCRQSVNGCPFDPLRLWSPLLPCWRWTLSNHYNKRQCSLVACLFIPFSLNFKPNNHLGCLLDVFLEPTLWLGRLDEETTSADYTPLTKSHSQNTNPIIKSTSWKAKVWKQKLQAIGHTYLTLMFVWRSP